MESYDDILNRMTADYASRAGFTPAKESDIMLRLRVLAGEIFKLKADAQYIMRQLFPSTATGEYLDRHAAERGLTRRQATKATGKVYFYPSEESHADILIPAGTEVCTYTDMMRFTTDSDAILHEEDSRVLVDVTAAAAGSAYNARGGTVTIIVTPVPGVGRVFNGGVFNNGTDDESDEELRARVIDSYVNIVNGANAAYYKSLAMSVPGVYSASVVGRGRGNGTVDVYISAKGDTVPAAVKSQVQQLMDEGRELNVDVLVRDPEEIAASLYIILKVEAGYVFDSVAAQVSSAVADYIDALGIGTDVRLSSVGEVIYHIEGVESYRFVESYGSDCTVGDSQYATAGSIIVRAS